MVFKDCRYCWLDFVNSKTAWVSELSCATRFSVYTIQKSLLNCSSNQCIWDQCFSLTCCTFKQVLTHTQASFSLFALFLTPKFQIISLRLWHLLHHMLQEVYSRTYIVSVFQRVLHIKRNKGGVLHCNCCKHMVLQCCLQMRLHWWHQLWRTDRLQC